MNNILVEFEAQIRAAGVKAIPPDHPLPCLKILLHDLVNLHKARLKPQQN